MSSAAAGWLQLGLLIVALAACYVPLGQLHRQDLHQ